MTNALTSGAWRDLPDRDKQALRDRLAEASARVGRPLPGHPTPGALALAHDPRLTVQRPHLELIDTELARLLEKPNGKLMVFTPPQVGKLVAHDEPVPTPHGWKNHGDLRPGDEVFHPSGMTIRIVAIGGDGHASLRVTTSDGGSVNVHPHHEWTVYDRNWKRWATMETREILARKLTTGPVGQRGGRYVFQLPHQEALEGAPIDLPIDPYTLGLWLGDGSSTKAAITHHANDHYDLPYPESARCAHATTGVITTYYRGGLHVALKALGVHGAKHIPTAYLRAPESARRDVLAGLVDSDGTIAKAGQVTFSNVNKRLIDDVAELIRSLGYRVTEHAPLAPRTSSSGIVGKRTLYRLSFTPHDGIAPARLVRKAAMSAFTASRRRIAITAIEAVEPRPGRCITVDSPDGLYLVGRHMIPTHNSMRVSRWFPFWWLTGRPADRIVLAAYASSLATTHAAACRDLVEAHGPRYGLRLKDDESTRSDWTCTSGGGLRARGVRSGLTGQPMDLGIIDDPLADRAQADSPTFREAVWEWYSSAYVSRMSPEARQVIVMTRWHQLDLAGRLLEREGRVEDGGEWTVLHLPAVAVAEDRERGFYADPLGRALGEPLTHPRLPVDDSEALSKHWARQRAASTSRDWGALYQGSPFDSEGSLLTEDVIRDRTGTPGPAKRVAVAVDPSGGGRDTAGIIGGHLDTTGKLWWTHSRTGHMSADKWSRAACLLAEEIGADRIIVEANYGGDQATTLIRQAWLALQNDGEIPAGAMCPLLVEVHSRRSKVLRAEPVAQAVLTARAWFGPGLDLRDFRNEWTMWEPGSTWSPGALDAGVHLAYALLPKLPAGAVVVSVAGRRRSEVKAQGIAARKIR